MFNITFLGHACFIISGDSKESILIDPYILENPQNTKKIDEIKADYILISHAHADHFGDTYEIAYQNTATIISTSEIAKKAITDGFNASPQHIGGRSKYSFGSVKLVPAFHGSGIPGGHACGFVIEYYGFKVYFAGDTGLFGDMKLIGDLDDLDIALLPIGDNFTMGIDDAIIATSFLHPKIVIPYHYNTWPIIEADPNEFKRNVEDKTNSKCIILYPGNQYSL